MQLSRSNAAYLSVSALLIIIGILFSGPLGVLIVDAVAPQPSWEGAETFVENYSRVQSIPYAFGFLVVGAYPVVGGCCLHTTTPLTSGAPPMNRFLPLTAGIVNAVPIIAAPYALLSCPMRTA